MEDAIDAASSLDYASINIFPNQNRLVSANAIILCGLRIELHMRFPIRNSVGCLSRIAKNSYSFKCHYAIALLYGNILY